MEQGREVVKGILYFPKYFTVGANACVYLIDKVYDWELRDYISEICMSMDEAYRLYGGEKFRLAMEKAPIEERIVWVEVEEDMEVVKRVRLTPKKRKLLTSVITRAEGEE